jgi:chorismate mutase
MAEAEKPSGNREHAREVVRQAHEELRGLLKQRAEVVRRIGTVKQTIVGLANLFGDQVLNTELMELTSRRMESRRSGFTKMCRLVLMEAGRPLAAREVHEQIRLRLPAMLEHHKDPMASIITVLNRLVSYGEARGLLNEHGRRVWEWVTEQ